MARIVAATQDVALRTRMDAAPTMRRPTFIHAQQFLKKAETGATTNRLYKWAAHFRWRHGAVLTPSSLLQALEASMSKLFISKLVIHLNVWYEANKSELQHKRGRALSIKDTDAPACGGAVTVPTPGGDVMFMPPNIANWLYQGLADVIVTFQTALDGGGAFDASGKYLTKAGERVTGGEIVGFWGTELGSRRDQAILAWDYDVDFAIFVTPDVDIDSLWRRASCVLKPLGMRCIQHKSFKFRFTPTDPVAWFPWRELYQETREQNMHLPRPKLVQKAASLWRQGKRARHPHGGNCIDVEIYKVRPDRDVAIRETGEIVKVDSLFPIIEGALGPLRIPLPRTPVCLDAEYGLHWREQYVVKVPNGTGFKHVKLTNNFRRTIWPSQPLQRCEHLLGAYQVATTQLSTADVFWRNTT